MANTYVSDIANARLGDFGNLTLQGILSPENYTSLTNAYNANRDARQKFIDLHSQVDSGSNARKDVYDYSLSTPEYQNYKTTEKALTSALDSVYKTPWKPSPGSQVQNWNQPMKDGLYNQLVGFDPIGVREGKNSFLDKVGGGLAKTIGANPWVLALPMAAAAAAPALGALGAGASTTAAGNAGALSGVLPFAPAGFSAPGAFLAPAAGAAAGAAAGSAASGSGGFFNSLINLPSTVSTSLGDGTLGAIGSGAVKGGVIGGVSSGLTGGNIGKGILSGAASGGALGGAGSLASDALSGTEFGDFLGIQPNVTTADKAFLGSAKAGSGLPWSTPATPSIGSTLGKALGFGGGGSSSLGGNGMGTLATILGGVNDYTANKRALKDLTSAGQQATNMLNPYMQSGAQANSRLADLLGLSGNSGAEGYGSLAKPVTADSIQNDPGYQFTLDEGNKALDRRAAAGGGYFSGAALKGASKYNQGVANTYLNDASQRDLAQRSALYSMLSGQSGAGLNAANAGAGFATDIGSAKANSNLSSASNLSKLLASIYGNNAFSFA